VDVQYCKLPKPSFSMLYTLMQKRGQSDFLNIQYVSRAGCMVVPVFEGEKCRCLDSNLSVHAL